ncbi:NHS-like protein 1 isoform X3 [Entelurus aequoreus]|uniref:NHS-like protein 1 isoform X3 n=1 Tax=Entelurus aequoreus TaxID=161455 RepID=UPI002B1E1516|nr:NHS-like protein 1 isoform X3 [Entelurus aequoreus]
MITYVHCLSSRPVVSCWHRACYEDPPPSSFQSPNTMGNSLQSEVCPSVRPPRTEGCLRKRMLSMSKIHQKQDSLWTPKPLHGRLAKSPSRKSQTSQDNKAVSNLDEESKWTVHYTAPWHQQENVFLPGSRPSCVEDLHRQAKVNLKSALRECDKLRKDGFRSSQYYSQGPTFSDPLQSSSSLQDDEEEEEDVDKKSIASSADDDQSQLSMRSQTPLTGSEKGDASEADGQGVPSTKAAHLPTPEERMRQTAQSVPTDIIAINVTGAVFDRQASIRRSLVNTDTVSRRPKKVKRRKTISGLPDNFDLELAAQGRGGELRPHSMFIPGQYSTLGRVGSVNSTLRRSQTRDSGCQTEVAKVVPPSMRRIRAQRGQGIAAQMAGISASSSTGSISISSNDSSGIVMLPHQRNGDPSRFHSLPRQGARVSLSADPIYSSTPIKSEERNTPQRQIGKLQVDDTVVHMRNAPRTGTLPRPKSQEMRRTQSSDWAGSLACAVSPHAAYSTSFIPNATLPSSSEVVTVDTSGQHSHSTSSAYQTARPLSLAAYVDSLTSSPAAFTHSSTCPALAASTPVHTPLERSRVAAAPASESGQSDNSLHSHSTLAPTPPSCQRTDEQWIYDTPENVVVAHRTLTSSSSTPINQLYNSLEVSSKTTTDSSSLYSQDNDGYYTSMHLDSGLRSRSHGSGHSAGAGRVTRHSMYECREMANQEEYGSLYSDRSLSRSISLRKSKKPPLPPARTDSLKRKPGPKKPLGSVNAVSGESNNGMLSETLIATLQQSLQMGLRSGTGKGIFPSSPSQSPCSDYDDPWVLRPRSHSTISTESSATSLATSANGMGVSNVYSLCHVTPTHSDTSSLRSDYADSWGYYMEYPRNHGDQSAQTPAAHTANTSTGPPAAKEQNGTEIHGPRQEPGAPGQEEIVAVKPKTSTSSPERVHRLTSPSSGYSSQSNTPTAGTPVPSGIRSMSPSGSRPKPKVPERKSSLISSSSSTSLSSNTSDSLKSCGPTAPPPVPVTSSSAPNTPLSPPPAFPPSNVHSPAVPPPAATSPRTPQAETLSPLPGWSTTPEFPPPPSPETLIHPSVSLNGSFSPPPPPPVSLTGPPPPPPLPAVVFYSSSPSAAKEAPKAAVPNSPTKSPMPLVTPFALQSVQLRSVKRPEKETDSDLEPYKDFLMGLQPYNLDTSQPQELMNCFSDHKQSPSPVSDLMERLSIDCSSSRDTPDCREPEESCFLLNGIEEDDGQKVLQSPFPVKQKPPIISKKPKLFFVPPPSPQPVQAEDKEEQREDEESLKSAEPQEDIQDESHISTGQNVSLDQEFRQNGETPDDDADETSSSAGSTSSSVDDAGDVFDSNTAESSPNGTPAETMVTPTPTPTRTTEDLFAVIHRSKRKVLGRKESEEEKSRSGGQSPSPPMTPTNTTTTTTTNTVVCRQTSSIQRHLRRSTTSSDTFKALLLKKGSRSETSFRMSAAEMLRSTDPRSQRSTDPRSQRSRSESALDSPSSPPTLQSPCASPGRSKRAAEEWQRYEAPALYSPPPSAFPTGGSKYGRSRTPPSAASSKYNARCRILSSPMTVICEREGELAESEYGDAAESLKASNGTLSQQP